MARPRDPRRDKAKNIWLKSQGEIKLVDLAEQFEVTSSTIRKWKATDKWDDELKGSAPKSKKSAPNNKTGSSKNIETKKEVVESVEVIELESDEFTDKQRLFISYYVKYWNATKAYKKAYGCAYDTARTEGSKLLANPNIRAEIVRVRDGLTEDALLDERTLIQKWIDILFADITDYVKFGRQEEIEYQEDGQPALDMNGNVKTYSFNYVHLNESDEIDGTLVTEVKQGKDGITVKLADKMKALEYLSKHKDLLNERELKQLQTEQAKLNIDRTKAEIESLSEGNGEEESVEIVIRRKEARD
ncbi:terminase small subunit [Lysinibacillus antri]|uniref:PBSX phage terminase small subunit-like N-terminal domain-containing protein n=1 Tax=Lysinibacillus antri TaxID=2498145 RepID=A0A432LI51_9BACI|nr:terminase small subunit [Lysinibacillus antri]RUL56474.1 hypothetical protein EK386_02245 [Lysinibacillus antri]